MKIIIAGGRDFDNYEELKRRCDHYLKNQREVTILSGAAQGADELGERYAKEKGYKVEQHKAEWKRGRQAGMLRNIQMAKAAEGLIVFWDGESKGTAHMIKQAEKEGLKIRIVRYKK